MGFFDFIGSAEKTIGGAVGQAEKNVGGFFNSIVHPQQPAQATSPGFLNTIATAGKKSLQTVTNPSQSLVSLASKPEGNNPITDIATSTAQNAVRAPLRGLLSAANQTQYQPQGKFQQALLGKEPVANVQNYARQVVSIVPGGEKLPAVAAFPLGLALSVADLNPLGGGEDTKIFKELASITKTEDVAKLLTGAKDLGLNAKTVAQLAPQIAKSTDPNEIRGLLKGATSVKNDALAAIKPGVTEQDFNKAIPAVKGELPKATGSAEEVLTRAAQDVTKLPLETANKPNYFQRVTTPVQKVIENMGNSGKQLSNLMTTQRDIQDKLSNDWLKQIPTVNKLGKKEIGNFFDVVEHGAQAETPKIAQAVKEWTTLTPAVREEALRANLNVGNIENYVPHNYQEIFKDKNKFNGAVNYLIDKGLAKDAGDAIGQLNGLRQGVGREGQQFGQLEKSRLSDLPYYEKSKNVLQDYITKAARRVSEARTYGPQDEIANKLIAGAGKEGHDIQTAKRAFDISVGNTHYDPAMSAASNAIRSVTGAAKLGTAAVSHLGQPLVNTAPVAGIGRTIAAYAKTLSPEGRAFVEDSAVRAENVISELKKGEGYTGFLSKITAPGLNTLQKLNRSVSAIAGRDWAISLAEKAANGDSKALDVLKTKLGVTGEIGAKLTRDQEIQAARRLTDLTQFRMGARDLPMFADSPEGKLITQFRTFGIKETGFMKNEILAPAAKGNFAPLLRLIAVGLPVGYGINTVKNAISGHDASGDSTTKQVIDAYNRVGAFGLPGNIAESFQYVKNAQGQIDSGKVLKAIAGDIAPSAGIAADAVDKSTVAANGKPGALAGLAASNVPVVGARLASAVNPYTPKGKAGRPRGSGKGKSVKGRLGGVGKVSRASRGTKARAGTGRGRGVRVSTKSRAIKAIRSI